jgi:hypothetical protein
MKVGDMVRFAKWEDVDFQNSKGWPDEPKPYVGILMEHELGRAAVLHEGVVLTLRSVFVEKAGKKDIERYQNKIQNI